MQLAVLLRRHGGRNAAAGWDGDRYAVFEGPHDRLGLVWFTTWDSDDDAREFARGYIRFQTAKIGSDAPEPDAFPASMRRPYKSVVYAVERRNSEVVVVEGFSSEVTEKLVDAALRSKKTEITYPASSAAKPVPTEEGKTKEPN
jgi:hypothetical protein